MYVHQHPVACHHSYNHLHSFRLYYQHQVEMDASAEIGFIPGSVEGFHVIISFYAL